MYDCTYVAYLSNTLCTYVYEASVDVVTVFAGRQDNSVFIN